MTVFVCAHGAGGHKDDRGMRALANALEPLMEVVRFDFPYRERGAKLPDPMPVLKESIASAAARVRGKGKLLIGGRSMGGRAASMLAADGFECDGLLLLAYPLHPAGRPEKLRDAHLASIRVPVLCFNGTRDTLCRRDLMERALEGLSWQMHWLEGASHTFRPRDYPVIAEITGKWLSSPG
jgi:predicted alpha/beta-hydrolase family hydrolase